MCPQVRLRYRKMTDSAYNDDMAKTLRRSLLIVMILISVGADSVPAPKAAPETDTSQTTKSVGESGEISGESPGVKSGGKSGVKSGGGGVQVAVIPIKDMIYDFTLDSFKRRVDRAIAAGATVIVLELDTPGGVVTSALDIAKYIKADITVPTAAWVHHQAYSAGILIASACDQIIMSPASTTGDCAPIVPGMELAPTERAKALSPILEEFRDNAQQNGYDYAMFHAMCVLGVEVYQIQNIADGRKMLVNQTDYSIMVEGKEPEKARTAAAKPDDKPVPANLPNIYGVSSQVATDADKGKWKKIKLVHDGKTLLTVNQNRAFDMGLASSKTIRTDADLKQYFNATNVTHYTQTWSEDAAGWLTHPIVRSVLVLVLMLGAYVEFQTPGLGLAGGAAVLALVTLLGAPYLIDLAQVWHIVLFIIGFALLMVELLIIPGFGIFGIGGLICMFIGLVMMAVPAGGSGPFRLPPPEMVARMQQSLLWMMMSVAVTCACFVYILKNFASIPLLRRLVLQDEQRPAVTTISGSEVFGDGQIQVGHTGRASTDLHPTGRAEIDGRIIDVVTQGSLIGTGKCIKVVEVHGNRIVVDLDE